MQKRSSSGSAHWVRPTNHITEEQTVFIKMHSAAGTHIRARASCWSGVPGGLCGSGGSGPGAAGPRVPEGSSPIGDRWGHGAPSEPGGSAQVSRLSWRLHWTTNVTVWTLLLQVWIENTPDPSDCPHLSWPLWLSSPVQVLCALHDDGPAGPAAVSRVPLCGGRRQSSSQRQLGSNHRRSAGRTRTWECWTLWKASTGLDLVLYQHVWEVPVVTEVCSGGSRCVCQELRWSRVLSTTTRSAFTARTSRRWSVACVGASGRTADTRSHLWAPSTAAWRYRRQGHTCQSYVTPVSTTLHPLALHYTR